MKDFKGMSALKLAFSLLKPREKKRYLLALGAQSALSFLDLVGVALISLIGSLAIRGVQSLGPGNRVNQVLGFIGLENQSFQFQIAALSGLALLFLSSKTILSYIFTRKLLKFLAIIGAKLTSELINKTLSSGQLLLQEKSRARIQYSTGDGVTAMTVGILGLFSSLVADSFLLIVLVFGIFLVDPYSAITTLIFFGTIGAVLYLGLHKKARLLSRRVVELNVSSSDTLFEAIGAFREIYVRNRRRYYLEKFSILKEELALKSAEQALLPNLSKYAIELSVTIGTLLVAGIQFTTQDSSRAAASLALFLAAGSRLAPALLRIQQGSIQIQANSSMALPTAELLDEYSNTPFLKEASRSAYGSDGKFNPSVSLRNVSYRYPNSPTYALQEINLEIIRGEMLAIVGPSGSGKSTLVDLILGILTPTAGSVELSGISPNEAVSIWPGKIGYVPQYVNLLNDSVSRNLQLGFTDGEIDTNLMLQALELAQLSELELELNIGENGSKLSGGQRQRIGIARALLLKPDLLIMDEATSSLDSETEFAISTALENLRAKVTLIVVAHRLSTVKSASRIAYIEDGWMKDTGTFAEIRARIPAFDSQAKLMGL